MTSEDLEADKLLTAKINDLIDISERRHISRFSFFLDKRQCILAEDTAKRLGINNYMLYGGHSDAERCIVGFFPCIPDKEQFPVTAIEFKYRKQDKLSHRDFLGAIMALDIKRDTIGDIIVRDGSTVVFA